MKTHLFTGNVAGSISRTMVLKGEIAKTDPEIATLLKEGFTFLMNPKTTQKILASRFFDHLFYAAAHVPESESAYMKVKTQLEEELGAENVRTSKAYDAYGDELSDAKGIWVRANSNWVFKMKAELS